MRSTRRLPLLLLILSLTAAPALARDDDDEAPSEAVRAFLAKWAERMRGVERLRVRFEQKKTLRILRKPRESSGRAFLLGKRLRMVIESAAGERELELGVNEGRVRVLYPRLKRLEVYDLDAAAAAGGAAATPFPMFGEDVERLPETYRIALERDGETDVLVMVPKAEGSPVAELRMRLRDFQVTGLVQKGQRGDTVELTITEFAIGAEVSEEDVELHVPEGTKVVNVMGGGEKKDGGAEDGEDGGD